MKHLAYGIAVGFWHGTVGAHTDYYRRKRYLKNSDTTHVTHRGSEVLAAKLALVIVY